MPFALERETPITTHMPTHTILLLQMILLTLPDNSATSDYTPNLSIKFTEKAVSNTIDISYLKIMCLNCHSLRSLPKRNQFTVLLSNYDVDIVLGYESHDDQSFSSEILPTNYKIIRKDRSIGGGGVYC